MGAAQGRSNVGTSERARRAAAISRPSSTSLPVCSKKRSSVVTIGSATSLGHRQAAKDSNSSAPTNYSGDSAPRMSIDSSRTLKQTLLALRRRRYTHDPSLLSARDKLLITESWDEMRSRSVNYIEGLIATAWLRAAENSPIWIWGLVGISECQQAVQAVKNVQFRAIVNGVRRFLHKLIVDRNLNVDAIKYESAKLGERHRNYFEDGAQMVYWDSFVGALTAVIELSQYELVEERKRCADSDSRRRSRDSHSTSSSSRRSSGNSTTVDPSRTAYAWQKLIRMLVDNMRAGYVDTFDYTAVSPLVFEMYDRPQTAHTERQCESASTSADCSPVLTTRRQSRLKTIGRIDLARYIPDIHAAIDRKRNKHRDG